VPILDDGFVEIPVGAEFGFALGGGGAKAYAELGAMAYLEKRGIVPSYFSGSSMGCVNAVLLASGYSIHELMAFYHDHKRRDFFTVSGLRISNRKLATLVAKMCAEKGYHNLEDLPRKVYVPVTVAKTGQKIILRKGNIAEVVASSTAAYGIRHALVKDIAIRREIIQQSHGLYGKQKFLYLEDSCYSANVPFELLGMIRKESPEHQNKPFFDFAFDVCARYRSTGLLGLDRFNLEVYVLDNNRKDFFLLQGQGAYLNLDFGLRQTNFSQKALFYAYRKSYRYLRKLFADSEVTFSK
jgi:hypothetical protein